LERKEGLEDVTDRLSEAFRGVLHAGIEACKPTVPGRRAPHPLMIEEPHTEEGEQHHYGHGDEEHKSRIGGESSGQRLDQPPGSGWVSQIDAAQLLDDCAQSADDLRGKEPERHAAEREPHHADTLEGTRIVRACQSCLAWLPEEDDAEEL